MLNNKPSVWALYLGMFLQEHKVNLNYCFPNPTVKAAEMASQMQSLKKGWWTQKQARVSSQDIILYVSSSFFFPKIRTCLLCSTPDTTNVHLSAPGQHSYMILETATLAKFYLVLRFSFLFLVFTAPFTAAACVAFACPVAFRCSNSLFRDGNAQLQVTQWIGTSFCNEEKKKSFTFGRRM